MQYWGPLFSLEVRTYRWCTVPALYQCFNDDSPAAPSVDANEGSNPTEVVMADFEKRLACVIKADGTIARGYMIESCQLTGENEYVITWKIPLQGEAKTNFAGTIGSALTEPVEPGFITVGLSADPRKMQVRTYDVKGAPAKRSFHIACFRDQ